MPELLRHCRAAACTVYEQRRQQGLRHADPASGMPPHARTRSTSTGPPLRRRRPRRLPGRLPHLLEACLAAQGGPGRTGERRAGERGASERRAGKTGSCGSGGRDPTAHVARLGEPRPGRGGRRGGLPLPGDRTAAGGPAPAADAQSRTVRRGCAHWQRRGPVEPAGVPGRALQPRTGLEQPVPADLGWRIRGGRQWGFPRGWVSGRRRPGPPTCDPATPCGSSPSGRSRRRSTANCATGVWISTLRWPDLRVDRPGGALRRPDHR